MDNPYCSCKLTRVRYREEHGRVPDGGRRGHLARHLRADAPGRPRRTSLYQILDHPANCMALITSDLLSQGRPRRTSLYQILDHPANSMALITSDLLSQGRPRVLRLPNPRRAAGECIAHAARVLQQQL